MQSTSLSASFPVDPLSEGRPQCPRRREEKTYRMVTMAAILLVVASMWLF